MRDVHWHILKEKGCYYIRRRDAFRESGRKAVIPAAGVGISTYNEGTAKGDAACQLLISQLLQYIVEEATSLGIEDIKGAKKYEPPVHLGLSAFLLVVWASTAPTIGGKSTVTMSISALSVMAFVAPSKEIF